MSKLEVRGYLQNHQFTSYRRHWFSFKKLISSNLRELVICPLGWHSCSRDDCRCNYRNSCSVDVRSEIFEEDPCPGTGKYIEAQYYCLGWCTLFLSTNRSPFANRKYGRSEIHDYFKTARNFVKGEVKFRNNWLDVLAKKKIGGIFEVWISNRSDEFCRKGLPIRVFLLWTSKTVREKGQDPWFSTLW